MNTKTIASMVIATLAIVCTVCAIGPDWTISWYTIDGGGATSTGDSFAMSGTIGQADAGVMTGGGFELRGGFWTDPPPPTCPGDLNGDTNVNVGDLLILLGEWGVCGNPTDCPADLDGQGAVNVSDLLVLLGLWGPCP